MERKVIKTRVSEIWLGEDGIIRMIYFLEGAVLGLEDAKEAEAAIKKLAGGKPRPLLGDVRKVQSANRENRMYVSRPEFAHMISAGVLLVDSPMTQMLGNFFIKIDKPSFPVRLSMSEEDALVWLGRFVESDGETG